MRAKELENILLNYTLDNSNFETERNYISLSNCVLSVEDLIAQYRNGFSADDKGKLRCYKGYQMEADIVARIRLSLIKSNCKYNFQTNTEISAFNGKVKGHPDFTLNYEPCDVKSVLKDDWIPINKLPKKVYWQMQGYMLFSNKDHALIVYESRESGIIKVFDLYKNTNIQTEIQIKMAKVVENISQWDKGRIT